MLVTTRQFVFSSRILCASMTLLSLPANATLFDKINELGESQWGFLSTNSFQDAWPNPLQYDFQGANQQSGNPGSIIRAWSSFAWDSERDQLIMYGGGHANYAGNEIYLWNGDTGTWGRGSLPSEIVSTISNIHYTAIDGSDNAPISSHTYDNNIYLPIADRFVTFGGAHFNSGGGYYRDENGNRTGPYFWDPSKANQDMVGGTTGSHVHPDLFPNVLGGNMWENRDTPLPQTLRGHLEGTTAYAEENGKDVVYLTTTYDVWKYTVNDVNNSTQDTLEKVGKSSNIGGVWSQGPGAIDAEDKLLVRIGDIGDDHFIFYDLSTQDQGTLALANFFSPTILGGDLFDTQLSLAGMDYDPIRDRFVIWDNEGLLWELRAPETIGVNGWELMLLNVFESPDHGLPYPGSAQPPFRGLLGKWEYIPDYDIFLGMYDTQGGIWAYKPENWSPSVVPIPATGWLLGSALLGLVGMSQRRRAATS